MRPLIGSLALILALLFSGSLHAQDAPAHKPFGRWQASGYVKSLQSAFFIDPLPPLFPFETSLYDNLIHQRLNLAWYGSEQFTLHVEWRNRLFWGDQVRLFGDQFIALQDNDDFFDLSWGEASAKGVAIHSTIDRLYGTWASGNWEISLGRQRINWGISTVWNPNDLFNAFSFIDFDYEERPGSDALRVQYWMGFASRAELAIKLADRLDESVIAALYAFNAHEYDFQLIAGKMRDDWVLGGGWAGSIREAGFKGELTTFYNPDLDSARLNLAATVGLDYMWDNSFYLNTGLLYSSTGTTEGVTDLFTYQPSAKNLWPFRYAVFVMGSYPFTPLLNGSLAVIYSPGKSHTAFLNPSLTISIADNWDLYLTGQLQAARQDDAYELPLKALFMRLKVAY